MFVTECYETKHWLVLAKELFSTCTILQCFRAPFELAELRNVRTVDGADRFYPENPNTFI